MDPRGFFEHDDKETKPHQDLGQIVAGLGPEEVRVLTRIAQRLAMGQERYGLLTLARDGRDLHKEAREEIEDCLVYLACAWLKQEAAR